MSTARLCCSCICSRICVAINPKTARKWTQLYISSQDNNFKKIDNICREKWLAILHVDANLTCEAHILSLVSTRVILKCAFVLDTWLSLFSENLILWDDGNLTTFTDNLAQFEEMLPGLLYGLTVLLSISGFSQSNGGDWANKAVW